MKKQEKPKNEKGITLIALIITIIVLVILAAISISTAYQSGIIKYAVNGTTEYTREAKFENLVMESTANYLSSAIEEIKKITEGNPPEESIALKLGDYVAYTPTEETYGNTEEEQKALQEYSGLKQYNEDESKEEKNPNFTTDTSENLKWVVLKSTDETLTLISSKVSNSQLTLYGDKGYSNAVKLLKEICEKTYSNSKLGAKGRSIKVEDIEEFKGDSYPEATMEEFTPSKFKNYPEIFQYEEHCSIDGNYKGTLKRSKQSEWYNSSGYPAIADQLKGKQTWYQGYLMYDHLLSSYDAEKIICYGSNNTSMMTEALNNFWISSRASSISDLYGDFRVFYISDGDCLDSASLYSPYGEEMIPYKHDYAVRPVVDIDLTKTKVVQNEDGSYALEARKV